MSEKILNLSGNRLWTDWNRSNGRVMDLAKIIPEDKYGDFNWAMNEVAKDMTDITGIEVRWYNVKDSCCNCFGDYGYFIARKRKPAWRIAWHRLTKLFSKD